MSSELEIVDIDETGRIVIPPIDTAGKNDMPV